MPAPLSVTQAAAVVGCSTETIRREIRAGRLKATPMTVGRKRPTYRISVRSLDAYRANCTS